MDLMMMDKHDGGGRTACWINNITKGGHSTQDFERVNKALVNLDTNLGHPGVMEMDRVLKHSLSVGVGNPKGTTIALWCVCGKRAIKTTSTSDSSSGARLQWTFRFRQFESASLGRFHKIKKRFEHLVSRHSFPDYCTVVVMYDSFGPETGIPKRLAAVGTWSETSGSWSGYFLHDIILAPLEPNSVETQVTATESL